MSYITLLDTGPLFLRSGKTSYSKISWSLGSSLFHGNGFWLFCTKPTPKPIPAYRQMEPQKQTSVKVEYKYFLWSSKSFTLPQPANHFFIKLNLLRVINTEISHACCSLCWKTYNTALNCRYCPLIVKLLPILLSQMTCRMLLGCSGSLHTEFRLLHIPLFCHNIHGGK